MFESSGNQLTEGGVRVGSLLRSLFLSVSIGDATYFVSPIRHARHRARTLFAYDVSRQSEYYIIGPAVQPRLLR